MDWSFAILAESTTLGYGLQQTINGGVVAAFYSLLAVAYALLHGVTRRIVLSFGEIAMYGAFATIFLMFFSLVMGHGVAAGLAAAFALIAVATAVLGHVVQRIVFDPLLKAPSQAIMIASIGVAIVLQECLRITSGGREQWLPPLLSEPAIEFSPGAFAVRSTQMQMLNVSLAVAMIAALGAVMRFTRAGRLWRATSQNPALAQLCGIDTRRVISWTAMGAAAFAAAAGWIIAVAYGGVGAYMGLVFGLKALIASIIGGFGTLGGAVAGGIVLAALETAWVALFPAEYRDVAVFGMIVFVLIIRPEGLLGVPVRRDSEI
jgi:branched-chain amino acid transport system permease protein